MQRGALEWYVLGLPPCGMNPSARYGVQQNCGAFQKSAVDVCLGFIAEPIPIFEIVNRFECCE
jgi:hypothetical protein